MINLMMIITFTLMFITTLIMMIASFLSKKTIMDREKSSPFECGFDPFNKSRIPFSLRFFLIAVIFLIFDVEIAMLLPMMITLPMSNISNWTMVSVIFIAILLVGLFHEWNQGALEWTS
nr:NADH dehydrogenase subunit 3 [Somatochlora hineana]UZP47322.1 NADH dehydrogenase subunit 3 [Somatochlora hineana]UZP47323.1 NADH dehydrogenase subunit 3 [Somatochlora hineana]UZP47324.1 NADH dehydrogenase subunit 3 [Somatochlora hineana]UZP47325.1 NADH dehydrogenase subunit 3 [Somatochlora hineana]